MGYAYLFLLLLPVAGIAYIVWDHRRKAARREAESASRLEELVGIAAHAPPAPNEKPPVPDAPMVAGRGAGTDTKATAPVAYLLRERVLTPPQTLLYYLLKTGLPDHVVFTQTPIASVLEAGPGLAAYAREEQARIFARHTVDFVVTDKSTRPLAVVKLTNMGDTQQGGLALMRTWFAAVGVRFVELDGAALPRREAVRELVLGGVDSPQIGETDGAALR